MQVWEKSVCAYPMGPSEPFDQNHSKNKRNTLCKLEWKEKKNLQTMTFLR